MAYADTDGSLLRVLEETTWNVVPANSATWKTLRAKGWNLKPAIATYESEEISSGNVDVRDVVTHQRQGQVSITAEYSKDAVLETILEHVFRSAFATNVLKGGILRKSLAFEEVTQATAAEYVGASGMRVDNFSFSAQLGRAIEVQISGPSGTPTITGTSLVGTGSTAAAGTNRVLSLTDMSSFVIAGDVNTLCITELSLSIQNNAREQFGAGSQNLQGVGYGTRRVSGSFTAYFETREQMAKILANATGDLTFVLSDGTNSHTWRLPGIKYTDADKGVPGRSADIFQKFEFTAKYDTTAATAAMVTRT